MQRSYGNRIHITKESELIKSKSVRSLFMNHDRMLLFCCHGGHQTLENPVIPGVFGPLKLFPLERQTLISRDFMH